MGRLPCHRKDPARSTKQTPNRKNATGEVPGQSPNKRHSDLCIEKFIWRAYYTRKQREWRAAHARKQSSSRAK